MTFLSWQRDFIFILTKIWHFYPDKDMTFLSWQRYAISILTKRWHFYPDKEMTFLSWQRYAISSLTKRWHFYPDKEMTFLSWQRDDISILTKICHFYPDKEMTSRTNSTLPPTELRAVPPIAPHRGSSYFSTTATPVHCSKLSKRLFRWALSAKEFWAPIHWLYGQRL